MQSHLSSPEEKYTFPAAKYGKRQTPWNLLPLLYRGGASESVRKVLEQINKGLLGEIIENRVPLVEGIHQHINHWIVSGRSQHTAKIKINITKSFFSWCEANNHGLAIESVETSLIAWSNFQLQRERNGLIQLTSSSGLVSTLCAILDDVLQKKSKLHSKTQVHHPRKKRKKPGASQSNKQSLEEAYQFGHFLYDVTQGLSVDAIRGDLPVKIPLRMGGELIEWSRLRPDSIVKRLNSPEVPAHHKRETEKTRAAYIADTSLRTRHPLVNLRLEAELLIFIAETGLTLSAAYALPVRKYTYKSIIGGYELHQIYKDRAEREILGEIHSEYRLVFEDYLKWREEIFPGEADGLLFPLRSGMGRATHDAPLFGALRKRCEQLSIPLIGARRLRNLKINFLLRETQDPELTAEMAQHTVETLFRNYHEPNHQIAMIEISRFHAMHDPFLSPPGPGVCVESNPTPIFSESKSIPLVDCMSPSGCLFCLQQRDLESEDHVWSLLTFSHLKSIELSRNAPTGNDPLLHPAHSAILRIASKVELFEQHTTLGKQWIRNSKNKIIEGNYHPKWDGFIRLAEYSS